MANMPHMKRREGDEWFCPRCSTRWGVNENPPSDFCIHDRRGTIPVVSDIEPVAWLRDIDGTGSFHVCAKDDPGAFPVYK